MLQFFLQTTHFVKSRAHSPRPTSKIIAMTALRRAILMKADPVVSLHAHRLFSGRACSCKKDPCSLVLGLAPGGGGGGGTPYNGLYGEAPPERGTFFRPQVYGRLWILLVEEFERVGKSVIWVCKRA